MGEVARLDRLKDVCVVAQAGLGGILAAHRSNDDSGVPWLALIGRLSSKQLSLHYAFYRSVCCQSQGHDTPSNGPAWMAQDDLTGASPFLDDAAAIASSARGLDREGLLGLRELFDTPGIYRVAGSAWHWDFFRIPGPGILLAPTAYGWEAFIRGCGISVAPYSPLSGRVHEELEFDPSLPIIASTLMSKMAIADADSQDPAWKLQTGKGGWMEKAHGDFLSESPTTTLAR